MSDQELLAKLQAENARLISLLDGRGIEWRPPASVLPASEPSKLSTDDKVALFRRLFRGRTDIYPVRWDGKSDGKIFLCILRVGFTVRRSARRGQSL
jgi:hypothetical protein